MKKWRWLGLHRRQCYIPRPVRPVRGARCPNPGSMRLPGRVVSQGVWMSADNAYAVELKGLSFTRGTRHIFDNVDIRIPRGKVTGIMGPSGCGKTTLLRLIAAQLRPSS